MFKSVPCMNQIHRKISWMRHLTFKIIPVKKLKMKENAADWTKKSASLICLIFLSKRFLIMKNVSFVETINFWYKNLYILENPSHQTTHDLCIICDKYRDRHSLHNVQGSFQVVQKGVALVFWFPQRQVLHKIHVLIINVHFLS